MKRKRKPQPGGGPSDGDASFGRDGGDAGSDSDSGSVLDSQIEREKAMMELYGEGKAYPDPYPAGPLPNHMVHDRYKKRFNRETFVYSVRFRTGPLGIAFDNKVCVALFLDLVLLVAS